MSQLVSGAFEVQLEPLDVALADEAGGATRGRMSIDKQYRGALDGRSRGEMLTAMTSTPGSAGYVAIEKFVGTLQSRRGSFVLQHHATMTRGAPQLNIVVVPDSGTDELLGISGRMDIVVEAGAHRYRFDYELPAAAA
ncbi:DUF3224 domain-containing protein [Solimonas marina]|uniref:DUF3224 domain-containing protein n=1 Tax=Solimonas marina TaxID=2714601 RepID=A0A969WAS3_9GAMM|nr:DUF3224 domain-containing protein [Solimonas marina]NKF23747.1 DUF3224 domain-containing protein [Solimonas marina]